MKKLILALLVTLPFAALAQDEDDVAEVVAEEALDREPAADKKDAKSTVEKARYRLYSGGQDEQDLQVQANLPQPQRYNDGQAPVLKTSGEE